jgi:hypothetical protein
MGLVRRARKPTIKPPPPPSSYPLPLSPTSCGVPVTWRLQPTPDYATAVAFLESYASELELKFERIEIAAGRTVVLMTWLGSRPEVRTKR